MQEYFTVIKAQAECESHEKKTTNFEHCCNTRTNTF